MGGAAKEAARKRGRRRGAEVRYTPTKRRRAGDLDHTYNRAYGTGYAIP